ncbi:MULTISPECIES: S41 family peptidase [unclassified Spirosoma]|uniref:S41 family peptidase n=1 Tax=unclassified Spirosoma TaxID=2621999 RepID=UPI000B1F0983|nr:MULTISPECIES: S41 family peptidase [unclassified Spirosoma]MBN8820573.1 peptidase S41 [Spirosoma sp.]
MKHTYTAFLVLIFTCPLTAQPVTDTLLAKILQPADIQADFRYFRRLLEETHPGLYRYTPKPIMQAKLDSLAGTLIHPMPFYDFFRMIESLVADIRCAHTHALPTKDWQRLFNSHWKTMPFFMLPVQGRSYVLFNGTADQTIKPGFELIRINGQSIERIREQVYRYYWADGYNQTSKQAAFQGQLFTLFYYWFVDHPDTYHLTFRNLTGDTVQVDAPAQPFRETLKGYKKNPVNKQMLAWYNKKRPKHPWRLSFPKDSPQTALLRIDSFGGEGAKTSDEAIEKFRQFMDRYMATMEQKKTRHLIVDVRANPGGWDSQGIELFTYLMKSDSAIAYYDRQHSVTDSSEFLQFSDLSEIDRKNVKNELIPESDGTFTLKQGDVGRGPRRYTPKPNRFRGNVYILLDGRSASTTSEFLAVAHANKIGVFVGEEAGGVYEGGNGGSFIHLELPHSKIQVGTPLLYYDNAVGNVATRGRGTIPDYPVSITLADVLNRTDSQLDFVKKRIRDQTN